jgi:hypothetical protein
MLIYEERRDLQSAFPQMITLGNLSDLYKWARDFGVKEDSRLSPYESIYRKFCNE